MAGRKAFVIAAVVLAAAGCGGSARLSKADYQRTMQSESQKLTSALQEAGLAASTSLQDFASKIGSLKPQLQRAADTVDGLHPPKDAEADTQKIADGLHRLVDVVSDIQKAAGSGSMAKVQMLVGKLQRVGRSVQPAVSDLKKKGYDIGQFAG
jgi:flagellar hook-basal body complex protein FliE